MSLLTFVTYFIINIHKVCKTNYESEKVDFSQKNDYNENASNNLITGNTTIIRDIIEDQSKHWQILIFPKDLDIYGIDSSKHCKLKAGI